MRRIWRWRLCALVWVALAYFCLLGFIALVNLSTLHASERLKDYSNPRYKNSIHGHPFVTISRNPRAPGAKLPWCKILQWIDPPGSNTALVSFPGSGNTWLRYLLQQATGLHTGSVYKDYALMKNGFPAESVNNGSVLVVKTHEWGPVIRQKFNRAILVVRNPYEAILAEFNRQSGGHIGHASTDKFRRDNGLYWVKFVKGKSVSWMNTTIDWLQFEGPLHVTFFDDLVSDLHNEMKRILKFLEVNITQKQFDCMIKHQNGIYRRRKKPLPFDPFQKNLKQWVELCKSVVGRSIKEYLISHSMKDTLYKFNNSFFGNSPAGS